MDEARTVPQRSQVAVLIPAAGEGRRLGGARKQFRRLGGRSLLTQTLLAFERHPRVDALVVAAPKEAVGALAETLRAAGLTKLLAVVSGGATRQDSVGCALRAIPEYIDVVLVHDAVRPFVDAESITAVIDRVDIVGAAALALPVADTLRRASDSHFGATVPRDGLFRMQTPQGCRRDWFEAAHAAATTDRVQATDDVDLIQRLGKPVDVVPGRAYNVKITTPEDWAFALRFWDVWER